MNIATYGFTDAQAKKLARILKLSRITPYHLIDFDPKNLPDLLLVFGEEQLQQTEMESLPGGYQSRLILVSKKKPSTPGYMHLGYPLISSRVLGALDKLLSANEQSLSDNKSSPTKESENNYDKYVEEAQKHNPEEESSSASYRVLVVDDSQPMQKALAQELRSQFADINIDFADDGSAALDMVEQQDYSFIFLDIMMPGIDGFETCTRMRQMEHLKKKPIIMLSSKTSPLDEVKGIMAGSSTYLTKPIDSNEFQKLMARIGRWVDNFSTEKQASA